MPTERVALPYALLFISDLTLGDDPEPNAHVTWTDSSVCITCVHAQNGETTVTLGHASVVGLASSPVFDGVLTTPSRVVVATTAELDQLLKVVVDSTNTRVRIWENRPTEPDEIVVGLG